MRTIDINCDLGEGCGNDAEIMPYISSANIACGAHAGDSDTMHRTVELALQHSVAIGAHPGFPDRDNFGRLNMSLAQNEIASLITEQILALSRICDRAGGRLYHVKPHGALYNRSARDPEVAQTIALAIKAIDPRLILYGLSGSVSIGEAAAAGLRTASEVFADRTYQSDGKLTPRSNQNALIDSTEQALQQALQMVIEGTVTCLDGEQIPITAETICVHGDGEHAVEFARAINEGLRRQGFVIKNTL
jgi:UPF0271 protein